MNTSHDRERGSGFVWLVVAVALVAVAGIFLWKSSGEEAGIDPSTLHAVEKETLRISVVESGQLKAADSEDIVSEIRGSTTILELVEEGTWVKEGDVLVVLDASSLEDDLTQQTIKYEQAKAAFVQAEKAYEIQISTNASKVRGAQLDLDLAEDELEKWLEGGETLEVEKLKEDLALAESEMTRAESEMKNTAQLVERKFAAQTELDGDVIDHRRTELRVAQLKREQTLKSKFDWRMQKRVLSSDVEEREAELERVEKENEADLAKQLADRTSKKATLDLEEKELQLLKDQLEKSTIRSPTDGLVVYPTNSGGRRGMGSDRDRVEEGSSVRERQLLVSLPDTSRMIAGLQVHESAIDKVEVGQSATITIDASAGQTFYGKVSFVAPLPDSQSSWLNPDLKVYRVEVTLGGDTTKLRPGMSVSCEIVIQDIEDALAVPVHAVRRQGSHLYTYLHENGEVALREVEVGLSNDSHVAVTTGLSEGDQVYLAVPANAPTPQWTDEAAGPNRGMSVDELAKKTEGVEITERAPERGEGGRGERGGGGGRGERGGAEGGGAPGGFDLSTLTPEQRKRMEEFQKMTPEQRAEAARKFQQGGGGS